VALVAQGQFAAGHTERHGAYERLLAYRNSGLAGYAIMAVLVVALCRRLPAWPAGRRPSTAAAAAVVLVIVVAAAVRGYRLQELPPGLWVDEALNGLQAVHIARAGWPLVALPPEDVRTGLGAGFVDVAALAFAWGDPEDGPYALRAVAAAFGVAGVAAAARLAWVWFGPLAAVAAASWLAISQWHVNYSRWGEMPIMSPLIETLVALGVTAGLTRCGWRAWAGWLCAGALFGAGAYTYQTFRLWAVLALSAGLVAAVVWRRALSGAWLAPIGALLLAALVAAPMLHYALSQPAQFGERASGTILFGRDDWRQQLAVSLPNSLLAFQFIGDDNPRHNLPYAPLLSFVPAALAPLGLIACATRWRRPPCAAVVLWFAAALLPGVITLEAPHATRLLDASVPLALMIGLAVDLVASALGATLPRRAALILAAPAALVAGALMVRDELHAYFIARPRLPIFYDAFLPSEVAPGRYLAERAPDATVYLDPITYAHPATAFVARRYLDQPNDVRELRLAHDFPPRQALARDALYLLPRPYASFAAVLQAAVPSTRCEEWRDPFGRLELAACRVPGADLARLTRSAAGGGWQAPFGLRGRFWDADDLGGPPSREAPLPFALCEYGLDAAPLGRFERAEWDGTIDLPRDGEYYFRLNPDSTTLTIAGQQIIAHAGARAFGGGNEGRATLRAGRQPIRITLEPSGRGPYFLWFYWQPPGEEGGWVPATALRPPQPET
jgi:hypothetical protein